MNDHISWMRETLKRFPSTLFSQDEAKEALTWCHNNSVEIWEVPPESPLMHMHSPPRFLFAQGNLNLLSHRSVALVGTRKPSYNGLRASFRFASSLGRQGLCIVSGLALGVDGSAHRGALSVNAPTIAVLGHGLDRIYPSQNRELARTIVNRNGCLVSQFAPGVPPLRPYFPMRNQIIAALGEMTVVVEAAIKSGSLITAHCAIDMGRDVAVIPGPYNDTGYAGSHHLIQEGALLTTNPDDILMLLGISIDPAEKLSDDYKALQLLFDRPVMRLCELFEHSNLSLPELIGKLDYGKEKGWLGEIDHECYAWIAGKRNETCQI